MYTVEQPQLMFPFDAVAQGLVNPADLTPDQAFGGVETLYKVWDHDLHTDELSGRVYVNTPTGLHEAPAGLVIDRWIMHEDGRSSRHLAFVHATEGIQPLRYHEDGSLPHDVAARIKAENASRAQAAAFTEPPLEPLPLNAHIGRRKELAPPESRFKRLIRAAAQLATEALIKPVGRHHRPAPRFA